MRLLVCGGRDYADRAALKRAMNEAVGTCTDVLVIHGAMRGADGLAGEIARAAGVPVREFPANWVLYPRGAGPIRNQQMLDEGKPDLVLAAPGGAGTADMLRRARAAGIPIRYVSR